MYNKRNEFKRLILFAVRASSWRPTLKKDSNGYNNAGQGTFFNTVSKNLPKKKSMFARATKTKLDIDDDYV